MAPAIGIDLGTTHSCIAVCQNGVTTVIEDREGKKIIPSYVRFNSPNLDDVVVGDAAMAVASQNTAFHSKTLIGHRFEIGENVRDHVHQDLPFEIVIQDKIPYYKFDFNGQEKLVDPTTVSSKILQYLKKMADDHLGYSVTDAFIAVPASFQNAQREDTKLAGTKAGFTNVTLVNEPTATAVAYGLEKDVNAVNFLICDFGAATFEASVLYLKDREFTVKGTGVNYQLGGIFIDRTMLRDVCKEFQRQFGKDPTEDENNRLRIECAKAKRNLEVPDGNLDIEIKDPDFKMTLNRKDFDKVVTNVIKRANGTIDNALVEAKLEKRDINHIVLVGGTSNIPLLRDRITSPFGKKPSSFSDLTFDPEEAVAVGAAIMAAIPRGDFGDVGDGDEPSIVDIASRTLGIRTSGGVMTPIITSEMEVPVKKTRTFWTNRDNQTNVSIYVYEGTKQQTRGNNLLRKFELTGIRPAPKGPWIEVIFELDLEGCLHASARDTREGGKTIKITIQRVA